MLGRVAKIPSDFHQNISKEGVDFVNKVLNARFSYCKEPAENDWGTME